MVIDEYGHTLRQAFEDLCWLLGLLRQRYEQMHDTIKGDFDPTEEELDDLETRWTSRQTTPNDMRLMARNLGKDYNLLTSDEDPDEEFMSSLFTDGDEFFKWRNNMKKELMNGNTGTN